MKIESEIFRTYDIRGLYPSQLNERVAYLIGRAYLEFLNKKNPRIVVGRDNRLSSPFLFKALVKGIIDQGGNVIDIGLSTTPMLYFAVSHFKFDGGINITASHLAGQYNGFKLVRERAIPISGKSGLEEIKKMVLSKKFKLKRKGKIFKKEVLKEYLEFNLKDFPLKKFLSLKIVVDTANAVAGILFPKIFEKTRIKTYHLFCQLDGNFPNHQPDPLIKENLRSLQKEVREKRADLGVAFDGDGDRIIFVDERGKVISGDLISALISNLILEKNPGQKILYDIRSSNIVREVIEKKGGIPLVHPIGHALIKETMRKEDILFGGEFSGHFYHKNHYFSEAPLFVLLKILELISREKKNFSEIIKPFQKYYHTGEINFEIEDKEGKIEELKRRYQNGKILEIDGLRVDFKDWWFLARPSGTENLLRLVIEAKTKKLMLQKKKELIKIILSLNRQ